MFLLVALSSTVTVPIVVAAITAAATIVVAAITSLKRENKRDHNENHALLLKIAEAQIATDEKIDGVRERLEDRIGDVEKKVDGHIVSHLGGKNARRR